MGDKDLEKIIAGIESEEKVVAQKQMEVDRLREMVDKQKKLLNEQEKIIQEQNQKISSMFDVPADVELLKRRIGELRSEINEKDHIIEMKYGEVAQLQQELKSLSPQLNVMSKNFEQTYQQIGHLRAQLAEKEATMKFSENAIHERDVRVAELEKQVDVLNANVMQYVEESKKKEILLGEKISDLKDQTKHLSLKQMEEVASIKDQIIEEYRQKELQLKQQFIEEKSKMKEGFLQLQARNQERIRELENKMMDQDLATREKLATANSSIAMFDGIKKQYEEVLARYDKINNELAEKSAQVKAKQAKVDELQSFIDRNGKSFSTFEKLAPLLAKDTKFKIFLLVRDVGEVSLVDLAKATGQPSITVKKNVQDFIHAGLLQLHEESGKVALAKPPPPSA
ncbi:MAG: hypothetical protein RBG13Loki_1407 [Promethearchaeota archaeon CR_4]|nr:MAG: hypothetical protein RBG13Loki_1407 [Candidatus Lokiarchaeota archaeon CR_4]